MDESFDGRTFTRRPIDPALDPAHDPAQIGALSDVPKDLRPRERLLRSGGGSLSDAELVAVFLRTGRPGQSAVAMARELLVEFGGLAGLVHVPSGKLQRAGLRSAKAATLLAGLEMARRLARAELPSGRLMDHPSAVVRYLMLHYEVPGQEVVGALYLDLQGRLVGEQELYRGTLHRAVLEPRGVFRGAFVSNASNLLLFHTHPSGDPTPSAHDITATRRLSHAGEVLGIPVIDHLILGSVGRWVSMRRDWGHAFDPDSECPHGSFLA